MPITEKQRLRRKDHIGSSDMSAIMGLNPYMTAHDLWLIKTGRVENVVEGEAVELGNALEDVLIDWFEEKMCLGTERNVTKTAEWSVMEANCDAIVIDSHIGVECKTTGLTGGFADGWGDDETDEVPEHVIIQCHHQMLCADLDTVFVPALIGGRGRVMYEIERNEEIIALIFEKAKEFWACVENDTPPENSHPTPELAKKIKRNEGEQIDIPPEVMENYLETKKAVKDAKTAQIEAEGILYAILGDAQSGTSRLGSVRIGTVTSNRFDTKRFKAEYPEMVAQFSSESSYNRIYFKKPKNT